ncbi:flagellar hook basal-body protein [bacterium]|nr:flagellar hook basal-body protein [bacterium]
MNDSFVNALNTKKVTKAWLDAIGENLTNVYTVGYRESQPTFKTFLDSSISENVHRKFDQGKSMPGTSPENIYLEGQGFFTVRNDAGALSYTRLGEFKFDSEGVYRSKEGLAVQGYILNDKGEIMQGAKALNAAQFEETALNGGVADIPTTNIKLWIDPNNGKYLGKYDEFEFKGDGILYGKADSGKVVVPLFKVAIMNFHNPEGLFEVSQGRFMETEDSGKPVIGRGDVRGGLIEMSNTDFSANITYFKQAKLQMDIANKLVSTNKQLLEDAINLLGS